MVVGLKSAAMLMQGSGSMGRVKGKDGKFLRFKFTLKFRVGADDYREVQLEAMA